MEDGSSITIAGDAAPPHSPPAPPNPNTDTSTSDELTQSDKSDAPLRLDQEEWDITSISALAALRMLVEALEGLAEATGDIPPTPPVSRPTTPRRDEPDALRRLSSPNTAVPPITIGSPVVQPDELLPNVSDEAIDIGLQQAAIARRFFSKTPPHFSLSEYLSRIHKYCPHSPGVYLAAASFCHRLCVSDLLVPATGRTVHRLALASIRISAKTLEDHKWKQDWIAKVGGVSQTQLLNLEVAMCFLLDFDLWVDERILARRMFLLQQASRQGMGARSKLGDNFRLKLPLRKRLAQATA